MVTVAAGATPSVTVTRHNDVDDKTMAVTGAASNALGISGPVGVEPR